MWHNVTGGLVSQPRRYAKYRKKVLRYQKVITFCEFVSFHSTFREVEVEL